MILRRQLVLGDQCFPRGPHHSLGVPVSTQPGARHRRQERAAIVLGYLDGDTVELFISQLSHLSLSKHSHQ